MTIQNNSGLNRFGNKSNGFTLIELVMAVIIVGILASLAIPSFNDLIRRNRIDTEAERIFITLSRARNNAITTNSPSFVCRSTEAQRNLNGGIVCATNGLGALDWNADLMVYTILPGTTAVAPNNRFLNQRIQNIQTGPGSNAIRLQMLQNVSEAPNVNLISTANQNDFVVRFNSDGSIQNTAPFRIGICDNADNGDLYGKLIEVNAAGQIRSYSVDQDNAARNCTPNTAI